MNKRPFKRLFLLLSLLMLAPWPVAYAYDSAAAPQQPVQVQPAEPSVAPSWTVFGKAIGSARAGDLFYVDATNSAADIQVTLYITNTHELSHCYRYMILKVGVYVESGAGKWEKAPGANGEPPGETFVTLQYAQASFTLPGLAKYKVTIDGGSFYCVTVNPTEGSISPQFYLVAV